MDMLDTAIHIALCEHAGQRDKQGEPYILHVLRVMLAGRTEDERVVGALHDVVEDSQYTFDSLSLAGFPAHIIAAVDALSRRETESYAAYIERVADNPIATAVKLADLNDNMSRAYTLEGHEGNRLMPRYLRAVDRLTRPAAAVTA